MPKNTQMHMQWITVNGQSVPLVLPQYWDGEKWVVSSEQNPLPVKAELTGSNELSIVRASGQGTVIAGGRESIIIQPPENYIYEIISMQITIQAPSNSTTGSHAINIRPGDHLAGEPRMLYARYKHNESISYIGEFLGVPEEASPSEKTNQLQVAKGYLVGNAGLEVRYQNDTNAEHSGIRRITLLVKKIKVG